MAKETYSEVRACKDGQKNPLLSTRYVGYQTFGPSLSKCQAKLDEVARIAALPKGDGLVAYACWACNYTTSEILPARSKRED